MHRSCKFFLFNELMFDKALESIMCNTDMPEKHRNTKVEVSRSTEDTSGRTPTISGLLCPGSISHEQLSVSKPDPGLSLSREGHGGHQLLLPEALVVPSSATELRCGTSALPNLGPAALVYFT